MNSQIKTALENLWTTINNYADELGAEEWEAMEEAFNELESMVENPKPRGGLINKYGNPESKQEILNAICHALQLTDNAGDPRGNPLKEIRYIPYGAEDNATLSPLVHDCKTTGEIARPIFQDGTGENGYYDVAIGGDSGTAIFKDVTDQFIKKVW